MPSSSGVFDELRRMMEQSALPNYANAYQSRQAEQQRILNQLAAQRQSGIAGLLQGQQGLNWALSQNQIRRDGQPRPRGNQMELGPPKFLEGYLVTVRNGKTVWRVHHFEERSDPYEGNVRYYYLEEQNGSKQTREREEELRIHDAGLQGKRTEVDFGSVIIADEKRQQILEAIEQINQHSLIFEQWGFEDTVEKGRGVSMLFYGPPGTGKTLMAQAIANKLGKTLSVISTADIESSSPGESERNIRKHFKDAGDGKTILLFDECDSLIFTRAAAGPIMAAQVNELLSQIERFNGITLFTTNRLGTLDEAVNRRLALKLEFDMPSLAERVQIWQRMVPKKAPLEKDIDWHKLAAVEITGGYIKNVVLRAARMAAIEPIADKKKKITFDHMAKALRQEVQAMVEFEEARITQDARTGRIATGPMGLDAAGRKVIHRVEGSEAHRG